MVGTILYLCDKEKCDKCVDGCMHTADEKHGLHDIIGRKFECVYYDDNHGPVFAEIPEQTFCEYIDGVGIKK